MTEAKPDGLYAALAAFQKELPRVGKEGEGQYGKYARLEDVSHAALPLLGKHGLSFIARPTIHEGQLVLAYSLVHVSGERADGFYPLASDGTPQRIGSAITYARRYALCAVTGVAPAGDDDDGHSAQQDAEEDWRTQPPVQRQQEQPAPPPIEVIDLEPKGQPRIVTDDKWLAEIKAEIDKLTTRDYGEVLFRRVHEKVEAEGCTTEDGKALQADITKKVAALGKAAKGASPGAGPPSPGGRRREEVPA